MVIAKQFEWLFLFSVALAVGAVAVTYVYDRWCG